MAGVVPKPVISGVRDVHNGHHLRVLDVDEDDICSQVIFANFEEPRLELQGEIKVSRTQKLRKAFQYKLASRQIIQIQLSLLCVPISESKLIIRIPFFIAHVILLPLTYPGQYHSDHYMLLQ